MPHKRKQTNRRLGGSKVTSLKAYVCVYVWVQAIGIAVVLGNKNKQRQMVESIRSTEIVATK